MKRTVIVLAIFGLALARGRLLTGQDKPPGASEANLSQNPVVVTNRDIEEMLKAGISPEIVTAKIKTSMCQCDTSPAALAVLKGAGVHDSVILAIVQSAAPPAKGLEDIHQAKSVCLVDRGSDLGVFEHLADKLQKWGRWEVVPRPEQADLLLVFAESDTYLGSMNTASVTSSGTYSSGVGTSVPLLSMPRFLIAVDRASGRHLIAVSCERRGSAAYTAGVLVNRLRKQIEKHQKSGSQP